MSVFLLVLVLSLFVYESLAVDPSSHVIWLWRVYQFAIVAYLAIGAVSNFIRISETDFVVYSGFGKKVCSWDNVEGIDEIEVNGKKTRCIVLQRPVVMMGWDLQPIQKIPTAYRGRIVPIPVSGPQSYHESTKMITEIRRRAIATGHPPGSSNKRAA